MRPTTTAQVAVRPRETRFDALYREHAPFVFRVLRRFGVPEPMLDDLVQDVFVIVHRKLDGFEERGATHAWLFTICRRLAKDLRHSTRRAERRRAAVVEPRVALDPEEVLTRSEDAALVHRVLQGLDEPRRMVFHLVEIEGMTCPEASAILAVNLNTVYTRLRAARKTFHEALAVQGKITRA